MATCELEQLAFLPWAPIQQADSNPAVTEAAKRHDASPRQIVLAWLLARSPQLLPIPGTGSPEHVEANVAAAAHRAKPRRGGGHHARRVRRRQPSFRA